MQFTKRIFPDIVIFVEKKRVENLLWRKSAFRGEKVKNAGEKQKTMPAGEGVFVIMNPVWRLWPNLSFSNCSEL
jgi:hypothetical protein